MLKLHSTQHIVGRWSRLFALVFLLSTVYYLLPTTTFAQDSTEYKLLAPLPGVGITEGSATSTANSYIPGVIQLIIGLAGVVAVMKILFGGIMYMSTDAVFKKEDGIKHVKDALWGLFLIISAWIILNTLNPRLLEFNFNIKGLDVGKNFNSDLGNNPLGDLPETDWYAGCYNCVQMNSTYDSKPPGAGEGNGCLRINPVNGASSTPGSRCLVNRDLDSKLTQLSIELDERGIPRNYWRVTEGYPPTTKHDSACHNDSPIGGTCVDVALLIPPAKTIDIVTFIKTMEDIGLLVFYELPDEERLTVLSRNRELAEYARRNVIRVTGTPEHAHIRIR